MLRKDGPFEPVPDHGPIALANDWWRTEIARDDFEGGSVDLERWDVYESPGHAGKGLRRPRAFDIVQDASGSSYLRCRGTAEGVTGGMAHQISRYLGRWSGLMRSVGTDGRYHSLLLLWPDAEDWPVGGEVDFSEGENGAGTVEFFLHFGKANDQAQSSVEVDQSEWHWYELEWTFHEIRCWCDGVLFFRDTDLRRFPPRQMHLCVQQDWFPGAATRTGTGEQHVAAIRVYSL